jgi:ribosomal-protein-alanine N-acetyltransferase
MGDKRSQGDLMPIRLATPADIPHMRALELQADTAAHWAEREYGALFAPDAPRRIALIAAEEGSSVCGFLIARCGLDEWEIENVVVATGRRRSGVGTALVDELLRQAGNGRIPAILLEVRESNHSARRLYEKIGFSEAGRRSQYYANPVEDALLLKYSVVFL